MNFGLHVWKYTTRPRIIECIVSPTIVLPIYTLRETLQVNDESRTEALKGLSKLSFSGSGGTKEVYVNLEKDIIYLRFNGPNLIDESFAKVGPNFQGASPPEQIYGDRVTYVLQHFAGSIFKDPPTQVQDIAIDFEIEVPFPGASPVITLPDDFAQVISQAKRLKTLVVVLGANRKERFGDRTFVYATSCSMVEEKDVQELFKKSLSTIEWVAEEMLKVEVVYWDGPQTSCAEGCGCDPTAELKVACDV
jgi:hypothetical protein